jgi:hypothetical protein
MSTFAPLSAEKYSNTNTRLTRLEVMISCSIFPWDVLGCMTDVMESRMASAPKSAANTRNELQQNIKKVVFLNILGLF